tara:strand:+ start:693 stop:1487 length:795 start_codon:yes stop_codon:yes gene_type:complete
MKRIDLIEVKHETKIGQKCPYIEANITEDSIFYLDGEPVGFYMTQMTDKMCQLADIANKEFNSKNVPKTEMSRGPQGSKKDKAQRAKDNIELVTQMSAILGGIPPKPHMRRPYPTISSVHSVNSAQTFIKAMLMLAKESEQLIKEIMPKQYEAQTKLFEDVDKKWRFGNLFTSSISNYNISAPFHRDTGNIKGAVNVIICKRSNSKGGDLHVPDYDLTIGQQDNSILVYPAWKNIHGVTPIIPTHQGGYRNSLIFYPLKAFKGI